MTSIEENSSCLSEENLLESIQKISTFNAALLKEIDHYKAALARQEFWARVVNNPTHDAENKFLGFSKLTRSLIEKNQTALQLKTEHKQLEEKVFERTLDLELTLKKLNKSESEFKKLTIQLQDLQEAERLKISREIHDVLGQSLAVLKMKICSVKKEYSPSQVGLSNHLDEAAASIDGLILNVQEIASQLRPVQLDDLGLEATIHWWLQDFKKRTGQDYTFISNLNDSMLPPEISIAFFRIVQEGLTNIIRHTQSRQVDVSLNKTNHFLELKIKDFGSGIKDFDCRSEFKSLGIKGMKERIQSIGGEFFIESRPQQGTCLTASIYLKEVSV